MKLSSRKKHITLLTLAHIALIAFLWQDHLNRDLFRFFNNSNQWPTLWANITILGDGYLGALALLTLAFVDTKRLNEILYFMFFAAILSTLFKVGFDMLRPAALLRADAIHITGPVLTRHSFPSGHSTTFFMYLFILWPCFNNRYARILLVAAAYLGAFSRIMVGAHWPADILGGFLTAGLALIFSKYLLKKYNPAWSPGAQRFLLLLFLAAITGAFFYDTHYPGTKTLQYSLLLLLTGTVLFKARSLLKVTGHRG